MTPTLHRLPRSGSARPSSRRSATTRSSTGRAASAPAATPASRASIANTPGAIGYVSAALRDPEPPARSRRSRTRPASFATPGPPGIEAAAAAFPTRSTANGIEMHIVNPPKTAGKLAYPISTYTYIIVPRRRRRRRELRKLIFWALTQGDKKYGAEADLRADLPTKVLVGRREDAEADPVPVERLRLGRTPDRTPRPGVTKRKGADGRPSAFVVRSARERRDPGADRRPTTTAWNRQDLDALCAFHADDIVFENHTAGERVEGAEAVRAHIGGIFERWPSLRFRGRRFYAADDFAVSEWTATATRARRRARSSGTASTSSRFATGRSRARTSTRPRTRRACSPSAQAREARSGPAGRGRGRRSASTVPPAAATTCLTIARPRPVPRVARAASARQKRSNSRGRSASRDADPVVGARSARSRRARAATESVNVAPWPA